MFTEEISIPAELRLEFARVFALVEESLTGLHMALGSNLKHVYVCKNGGNSLLSFLHADLLHGCEVDFGMPSDQVSKIYGHYFKEHTKLLKEFFHTCNKHFEREGLTLKCLRISYGIPSERIHRGIILEFKSPSNTQRVALYVVEHLPVYAS